MSNYIPPTPDKISIGRRPAAERATQPFARSAASIALTAAQVAEVKRCIEARKDCLIEVTPGGVVFPHA